METLFEREVLPALPVDRVLDMAKQAGAFVEICSEAEINFYLRFAGLVAAAEREACAGICDSYGMPDGTSLTAMMIANKIRRRGNV